MTQERPASTTWTSRRGLAWALRASTVVVPLVVAVVAMVAVGRTFHRPHGSAALGWYALLLAVSYAASWVASRLMNRTLPLAALLEMSLQFPERAPSRLGIAQRGGSAQELARLATTRPDESAQEAAERILKLLSALSAHDKFTRGHAERVRAYTDLIAEKMGLPPEHRERLRWAALLHDIGKLRVPSVLLNKPAKPTPSEWDLLRQHPTLGSVIAGPLLGWLRPMERVIAEHHERFDGTGYPLGLAGEAISPGARIVSVADCFEAMTAIRPYNKPMKREAALQEIVACAGTQFDPVVVRALLAVPQRRVLLAMGPTAWLAGLPMVGQGSLTALRTAVSHAGSAAVSATVVAVAALTPSSLIPSSPSPHSAPARLAAAAHPAATTAGRSSTTPSASSPGPAPSSPRPAPTPMAVRAPGPATTKATPGKPKPTRKPTGHHTSPTAPRTTAPGTRPQLTAPAEPTRAVATTAMPTPTSAPTTSSKPAPPTTTRPAPTPTTPRPAPTTPHPTATTPRPTPTPTATNAPAPPTTAAPTTAPTSAPTSAAVAACTATYASTTPKPDRLAAIVTVKNVGTLATVGWKVTWTWPTDQTVKTYAGAVITQSSKSVSAVSTPLDAVIAPGATATFTLSGGGHAASPLPTLTCQTL